MEYIIYILQNFRWLDFLDVLLVSFIIYRFLLLIKGTRGAQLLIGISIVALLFWISLSYELYALNWLLDSFFEYFFIFIIVIFQDQIRSTFIEIGQSRLFKKRKKIVDEQEIEEVVAACEILKKMRAGALIVIEREHGLYNYARTGTQVNCEIHSDVIVSFFHTASPLHDGAIILYKHKIQAAGCFLPLSKNSHLDRRHGTRHRAALGLSEISDAIVVCVSEETGSITISEGGRLVEVFEPTELSIKLHQLLYTDQKMNKKNNKKAIL